MWLCIFNLLCAGTLAVLCARSRAVVGGKAPPSLAAGTVGRSRATSLSWQKSRLGAHQPRCGDWHCALPSASLQGLLSLTRRCWGSPGLLGAHVPAAKPGSPRSQASPHQKHLSLRTPLLPTCPPAHAASSQSSEANVAVMKSKFNILAPIFVN